MPSVVESFAQTILLYVTLASLGCGSDARGVPDVAMCDRGACETAALPVVPMSIRQGIAGVLVGGSDFGRNGCRPCSNVAGRAIRIWRASTVPPDHWAEMPSGVLLTSIEATGGRFEQALDVGSYVVCADNNVCVSLSVGTNIVLTVNFGFGNPSVLVLRQDGSVVASLPSVSG